MNSPNKVDDDVIFQVLENVGTNESNNTRIYLPSKKKKTQEYTLKLSMGNIKFSNFSQGHLVILSSLHLIIKRVKPSFILSASHHRYRKIKMFASSNFKEDDLFPKALQWHWQLLILLFIFFLSMDFHFKLLGEFVLGK